MPVKKASSSPAASTTATNSGAAAAARPRKRSSLSLNGSTNGSDAAAVSSAAAPAAAAVPARKVGTKTRTAVSSTSIAAQQAAATPAPAAAHAPVAAPPAAAATHSSSAAAASPAATAAGGSAARTRTSLSGHTDPHVSTSALPSSNNSAAPPAVPKSSAAVKASTAAPVKSRTVVTATAQPNAATGTDAPVAAAAAPSAATSSSSTATVVRRQRASVGGSAAPATASPAPALGAMKSSGSATSTPPPPHSHHSDPSVRSGPPTPPPQQPTTAAAPAPSNTGAAVSRPRRATATGHADPAKAALPTAETSASPPPPPPAVEVKAAAAALPAAENPQPETKRSEHAHGSTAAPMLTRKRGSTGTALSTKAKTSLKTAGAADPAASVERVVRKKVVRRGSEGGTTAPADGTRPSSALASRRSSVRASVSTPATAANTAPPTRDPSVAQPPHGGTGTNPTTATAAAVSAASANKHNTPVPLSAREADSLTSTALNTARDSVAELDPSALATVATTPNAAVAPLGALPRRSRGPVVSEEWARSIIKPGDEQLLYAPANAAFARTQSGTGATRDSYGSAAGSGSAVRRGSKGRTSPYDPQLRRAQQTVLQQRHLATPTPGRRSAKDTAAAAGASAAPPSATAGGSGSRLNSTVKRSGTRLQQLRQETEERQRSLNATLSTPNNEEGSAARVHGSTLEHSVGGHTSASPTPSRMSEGSAATGMGGAGGRHSAGTPLSRRSTGSNDVPLDHIPGAASVAGASFRNTPPSAQHPHPQRSSPSLALFARPSPRIFSTPSPRGSTGPGGVPGKMVTFGVSNAPYYTGNEELTKLTRVREDMLRALMLSSTATSTPAASAPTSKAESSTTSAAAASRSKEDATATATTTPLSNSASASSLLAAPVESPPQGPASPSAAKRPRQRIYGVDIRAAVNGETFVSPQKAPAADVLKPRGRVSTGGADSILASSMRQKPATGTAPQVSPSRSPVAGGGGGNTGTAAAAATAATRPKLDTADGAFTATHSSTRLPRRTAVATVALASLQPANTLGERMRAELVRQQQQDQSQKSSAATSTTTASTAPAPPRSAPVSFEEATRRLLLDPFFPLVSEENYQRLVLQNDEYNARKALIVRICATPPPKPSPMPPGGEPRRSGTVGPKAARALEMDLAEADEVAAESPAAVSTTSPTLPASFSLSITPSAGNNSNSTSNNVSSGAAAQPRRPSVQYGGPTAHATATTPSRQRSPSPGAQQQPLSSSSPAAASLNSPLLAPSPSRDSKLLVNAVMPSEKTGPIKPLAVSNVWYTPAAAPADLSSSGVFQATLSGTNLNSTSNAPGTPRANSPHGAYSRSPSASRSSSRQGTRRESLLHGAQQNMSSAALASQSVSSDSESTASDEAVDAAETALRCGLLRWGPFRSAAAAAASPQPPASTAAAVRHGRSSNSASTTSASSAHSGTRKGKKGADGRAAAAIAASMGGGTSHAAAAARDGLPPAMLDELDAYVHFFLKRFRSADAATVAEIGDVPDTPLALQRAIRQSLRLSCGAASPGSDASGDDDAAAELQDPLDDGSYHSQNVQYVLDLLGSMLQLQDAFCEDVVGGRSAARTSRGLLRHGKLKLSEADFLATVMANPSLEKGVQGDGEEEAQKSAASLNATRSSRQPRARPVLKLHDPELRAVELMFANHSTLVAAKDSSSVEQKK